MNISFERKPNPSVIKLGCCKAGAIVNITGTYCIVTDEFLHSKVAVVNLINGHRAVVDVSTEVNMLYSEDYELNIYEEE